MIISDCAMWWLQCRTAVNLSTLSPGSGLMCWLSWVPGLLHLAQCPQLSPMLTHIVEFFFLGLNSISLYYIHVFCIHSPAVNSNVLYTSQFKKVGVLFYVLSITANIMNSFNQGVLKPCARHKGLLWNSNQGRPAEDKIFTKSYSISPQIIDRLQREKDTFTMGTSAKTHIVIPKVWRRSFFCTGCREREIQGAATLAVMGNRKRKEGMSSNTSGRRGGNRELRGTHGTQQGGAGMCHTPETFATLLLAATVLLAFTL